MNKDRIVGIHQPNFFPWLGYFNKIFKSDFFVILDDVQFPKKGGSWSNRVKIIISGQSNWLTAPIVRNYTGVKKINEMEFNNFEQWKKKISKTIEINYKKAPFYFEVEEFIMNLILNDENNIAKYNLKSIFDICKILDIDYEKIMLSSNIPYKGTSNDLLVYDGVDTWKPGKVQWSKVEKSRFSKNSKIRTLENRKSRRNFNVF